MMRIPMGIAHRGSKWGFHTSIMLSHDDLVASAAQAIRTHLTLRSQDEVCVKKHLVKKMQPIIMTCQETIVRTISSPAK